MANITKMGSGAISGKMLLERIIKKKFDTYFKSG